MGDASNVEWPFLLLQGSNDLLVDPEGAKRFYRLAKSADKELKMYEGLYHEVFNEPEREMVIADMVAWIDARVPSTV
jgi:acylglycerol lipase